MASLPPVPIEVDRVIQAFAPAARAQVLALRALIYETAASTDGVGELQETLKWGEPAYLTPHTRSGTTVRLGYKPQRPDVCFIYVNCQTRLVDDFRALFADALKLEGNRAIVLPVEGPLPTDPLRVCIEAALTYHQRRR